MFSQKSGSDILARVGCTDRKSLFLWVFLHFDTLFWLLASGQRRFISAAEAAVPLYLDLRGWKL